MASYTHMYQKKTEKKADHTGISVREVKKSIETLTEK